MEAEVAALERQAAQLRASASELEEEQFETQRLRQLDLFNVFDTDRSGAVCALKLQTGWQKVSGVGLDQATASRLLQVHDQNGSGALEFDEFDLKRLEATLEAIVAEKEAEELAAREEERERQAKLEREQQVKEYYETLPGNQDATWSTRIVSLLAYFLPVWDAAKLGLPLGILFPVLLPGLDVLLIADKLIPWGSIVLFLALQGFGNRKDMPALLRFNFHQAVWLDVAVGLTKVATELIGQADAPMASEAWVVICILGFLLTLAGVAYSAGSTLLGSAPRSIPWVSAQTEESLGMTRPDLVLNGDSKGGDSHGQQA